MAMLDTKTTQEYSNIWYLYYFRNLVKEFLVIYNLKSEI